MIVQVHVSQHHHAGEKKCRGVSEILPSNVWSSSVDSLEYCSVCANVSTGGEAESTNEAGAEVGEDVPVEVGHHQDVVEAGVLDHVETNCVQVSLLELDLGVFLGSFATTFQEQTVAHPHDVGFVDGSHLASAVLLGIFESIIS